MWGHTHRVTNKQEHIQIISMLMTYKTQIGRTHYTLYQKSQQQSKQQNAPDYPLCKGRPFRMIQIICNNNLLYSTVLLTEGRPNQIMFQKNLPTRLPSLQKAYRSGLSRSFPTMTFPNRSFSLQKAGLFRLLGFFQKKKIALLDCPLFKRPAHQKDPDHKQERKISSRLIILPCHSLFHV